MEKSSETLVFAALEPYKTGWIETETEHAFYFEACGNPAGQAVLVLHGGPGSGCNPGQRRYFDPAHYRIVLFDQRGCGRSTPAGLTEQNTTPDLIDDIERLRINLGIDKWLLFGGSWGSTLALAYATTHPDRVTGMILRGIFLSRASEMRWFLYESRSFFPEAWDRLVTPLPPEERNDILTAYHRRVFDPDLNLALKAARNWGAFESSIISLLPPPPSPTPTPDDSLVSRARVQLHYLVHDCFLRDAPLLDRIEAIRNIPAIIIQGRYDMVCPPISAHDLQRAWPEAELQMIADAGHAAFEYGITAALVAATDRFKSVH